MSSDLNPAVTIRGEMRPGYERVLTPEAVDFAVDLHRAFDETRKALLDARAERQTQFDDGVLPDFLPETAEVREGAWKIAGTPEALQDRRTEITGPVDRKMMINALNSGAKVFMADFEDASSPVWTNMLDGQVNMQDWAAGSMDFTDPKSGKSYSLNDEIATLIIRPRGWHLLESHFLVDGAPMSGGLFDFAFFFFHNAKKISAEGRGPFFYLPKMESHLEARLWNDVFLKAEEALGLPIGTVKATVLIETLPAAFEMDEILYELKHHIVGLNCGRWDYIFSFIKTFRNRPEFLLPDRSDVVMGKAFLKAYSELLIKTCHRRGAHAMGGMAAAIPDRKNEEVNKKAFAAVQADKEREASYGHDGTWVAHPDLVPVALGVFEKHVPGANQIDNLREDVNVGQKDMLEVHDGQRTEEGLRNAIRVGVQYIEAWLQGRGAVPLYNMMEDAATAEICRSQIWQWMKFGATLSDGRAVDRAMFDTLLADEMATIKETYGEEAFAKARFDDAVAIFTQMCTQDKFETFLTLPAYEKVTAFTNA